MEVITLDQFTESNNLKIHFGSGSASKFARLFLNKKLILDCSWKSDLLLPEKKIYDNDYITVAIDQGWFCFSLSTNTIIALIPLSSHFIYSSIEENCIIILSELEIIILNKDFSIKKYDFFSDTIESYKIYPKKIEIILFDGMIFTYDLK
jgi:hypothetical protein